MMRLFSLAMIMFSAALSPATAGEDRLRDIDGGWHEALIVTSDLSRMTAFFENAAGWSRLDSGEVSDDMLAYLTDGDDDASGRYQVMKPNDFEQGWVRIIELDGVEQEIIRSNAQGWDTGGVFSIMTRSADIARNLKDAERLGWTAYNDPYDFGFGDLQLRNIVLRGPDGVNVAIYEWVRPKREDAPPEGSISKAFNSMQMVADFDAAKSFYRDVLNFETIQEGAFIDAETTPTNFALPLNYSTEIERDYAILIPEGADREAGRVELMRFRGFVGRDLSSRASLSNLGIASLLFPVSDIDGFEETLRAKGVDPVRKIAPIDLPPFGRARALTVSSPEGALLTFFQLEE